jgi:hypothetical protein
MEVARRRIHLSADLRDSEGRTAMRMSNLITLIAPLAVTLAVAPGAARAHGPHAHGRGGPCRQDVQALCPNVTPGPGGFRNCLEALCPPGITPGPGTFASCLQSAATKAQKPLSQACQDHLTRMQAKITAFQQACGGDVQAKCGGVSGPRAVFRCLHQQQDLSETCKTFLAAHHGHHWHHHHHAPAPADQ